MVMTGWITATLLNLVATTVRANEHADVPAVYRHMINANRAQLVVLAESGLIDHHSAAEIGVALEAALSETPPPGSDRPLDPRYIELERWLVRRVGPAASNIHQGRSRNDLGAVQNRMQLREWTLDLVRAIGDVRRKVQALAADHADTVMPGYTHAVQAQPTTVGHFLLAFDAGLARDCDRLRECYVRINRCPLGAAAFNTSAFPLDRRRLSDLLGFDAPIANSHDAIMVSIADSKVEFTQHLALSALGIGRFAQYILFQYDDPVPGIAIDGPLVTRSSIMPQKRNPSHLERLRTEASEVVGLSTTSSFMVHNTPMYEVKDAREHHFVRIARVADAAAGMYDRLETLIDSLRVREDVLRRKVESGFSTMTELADTLRRDHDVPFRVGHEVASKVTDFGREHGVLPKDLRIEDVNRIYHEVTGESLPLTAEQLATTLEPVHFIASRRGLGGPQPDSMRRLLTDQRRGLKETNDWVQREQSEIAAAMSGLAEAIARLRHR